MDLLGIKQKNIHNNSVYHSQVRRVSDNSSNVNQAVIIPNSIKTPYFKGVTSSVNLRTELNTNEERIKYSAIATNLNKRGRRRLEGLLKNGVLLNSNSNDNSNTLDNLYKIITEKRASGLEPKVVLKEVIKTIANPFIITQRFGDIPRRYERKILLNPHSPNINDKSIHVKYSGDCVAASIEFNLAKQAPAEFTRFAEQLTSPNIAVDKTIKLKNLADSTLDAVWLLNTFKIPYKMKDFDKAQLKLAPDKDAIIRAQIQDVDKGRLERSLVDVLMQSTFMNVGSQQNYNSLTDIRKGDFNPSDKGLIEFEKTFTESIVQNKNKISVTYQTVDENAKLVGYETDFKTVEKQLLDSLAMGENVIIGYTQIDRNNKIIGGHEITIIGAKQDKNGKTIFICNDTDDNSSRPIEYSADYIIPKIHHAGLPKRIAEKDSKLTESWVNSINDYRNYKESEKSKTSIA